MNYFNYFTEIEDAFVRRRGKHLFLSPMDWALMESWKQREIPLHLVLRAIERSFDSFEARPRKRSVKTLLYCQEEVEAQFAEWLESRVGANEVEETESSAHFSAAAISQHLSQKKIALQSLANANSAADPQCSETLTRAVDRLTELEQDLAGGGVLNARRLEDSLTSIERMLNDSLLSNPRAEVEAVTAELKAELKSYRSQMDKSAYEQMLDNLLMKRV
ncbi:MAG TPA: hypothetical protein VF251_14590, partial [Pyrinomonadaceae bacterium]